MQAEGAYLVSIDNTKAAIEANCREDAERFMRDEPSHIEAVLNPTSIHARRPPMPRKRRPNPKPSHEKRIKELEEALMIFMALSVGGDYTQEELRISRDRLELLMRGIQQRVAK
jgi:hypothetical protein